MWRTGPERDQSLCLLRIQRKHLDSFAQLGSGRTTASRYLRTNPALFLQAGACSCRWLHLPFTSPRRNKWLPKSLTHEKISGCCPFPYSIRGQIEKGGFHVELVWKKEIRGSVAHVYPRASTGRNVIK